MILIQIGCYFVLCIHKSVRSIKKKKKKLVPTLKSDTSNYLVIELKVEILNQKQPSKVLPGKFLPFFCDIVVVSIF